MRHEEKITLFIRMLYVTSYFDTYEKIIDGSLNEDYIESIIKHTKAYEKLLLYVYNQIDFYIKLPELSFLYN